MQPTMISSFLEQKLTVIYDHSIIGHMEYVSVEEAAEISGYSQQYIRRLLRQRRIQAVKKGYMWWVDLDSLKAYKQEMDSLGSEKFSPYREDE